MYVWICVKYFFCLQASSLPGRVHWFQAMLYWASGTGAVARGDDEGPGPGPGHSAPPHLCATLCQCGCASPTVLPRAGEFYTYNHTHCIISSISRFDTVVLIMFRLCSIMYVLFWFRHHLYLPPMDTKCAIFFRSRNYGWECCFFFFFFFLAEPA